MARRKQTGKDVKVIVLDPRKTPTARIADLHLSSTPGTDLAAWLDVAMTACDAADALAMKHFRHDLHIEAKPDRTYVTQADTAVEAAMPGLYRTFASP